MAVVGNACQSRRTTPARLLAALELLSRLSRRALLFEVIADAATGAYSALRAGWRQGLAPCRLAVIVGRVLRSRGWTGELKSCGPDCLAVIGDAAA